MRVLIVGAGPVGLWVTANLLRAGHTVAIVGRPATVAELRARGLRCETPTGPWEFEAPPVFDTLASAGAFQAPDLVCVCVKAYSVVKVLDEIDAEGLMGPNTATLIAAFQNGVGSEEAMAARYGAARVLAATTTTPVTQTEPGVVKVERAGGGLVWAAFDRSSASAVLCAATLAASGCGLAISDARSMKWSKLLLNLVGNATGAILDLPPARLYIDSRVFRLEMAMLRETIRVMSADGLRPVNLPGNPSATLAALVRALPDPVLRLLLGKRFTNGRGDKRPSFYFELANRTGRSEVAWLNGAVVEAGHRLGVQTPVNARLAKVMTALVSGRSTWSDWRGRVDALLRLT